MPGFVPGGMSKDLHQTRVYGTIPLMGAAHRCSSSEATVMYSEESVPEGALIVMYRKETYFLYGNQTSQRIAQAASCLVSILLRRVAQGWTDDL
jgi:hypothetical protein